MPFLIVSLIIRSDNLIAWNESPDLLNRLVELAGLGYTQNEMAKILWEEFPETFSEPPTRNAVKNAYYRAKDRVTGSWVRSEEFTVPLKPDFIGLTLGFFDIETTFSTQPIMLYGAIADMWGNVRQFHKGKDITNDADLVNSYARALEEYDILVSWNGKLFDIPVISARLAYHRLRPLTKGKHIDAMYYASGSSMRLGRRSLQSVSEYFNSENRKSPLSVRTWDAAMAGSEEAYNLIVEHCDADVLVLREVFGSLKDQIQNIHR
jgi:uncharacterized protein YprB with RNaseH-like and TPR domain